MTIRKIFSSRGFLIFPVFLLMIYWAQMYYQGTDIEVPIPYAATLVTLAAIVLGVGLLGVTGTLSHCGASLHAGWLNYIFFTAELHRWHHSAEVPEGHTFSVNYGVRFILWDRLFGTYYLPKEEGIPMQPSKR
jgi:sterol desaturase/sphingolipid hydroxylase (fatty acid hydroxylase superfamily)